MTTAYPYGAVLGILFCLLVLLTQPIRDARDAERYAKQQQAAKVAQNKRLFKKLYTNAEAFTFPVAAYSEDEK